MREVAVELAVLAESRLNDGRAIKLAGAENGLPDRLVLLPGERMGFLEVKRRNEVPTALQLWWLNWFHARGYRAGWSDTSEGCRMFVRHVAACEKPQSPERGWR